MALNQRFPVLERGLWMRVVGECARALKVTDEFATQSLHGAQGSCEDGILRTQNENYLRRLDAMPLLLLLGP